MSEARNWVQLALSTLSETNEVNHICVLHRVFMNPCLFGNRCDLVLTLCFNEYSVSLGC